MNWTEASELKNLSERVQKSIYMVSIVALRLHGEDRKDMLAIRKMLRELKAKLGNVRSFQDRMEISEIFGAVLLGLNILYSQIPEESVRNDILRIQEFLGE
ncbi:hypothetical protein [Metallosphaera javensis (ex Sakai et al. 2022)]|uniref:hypothetical protein n=1 Tax=Metallosphaera javensis (ex Sakai et al. 2022) TaxID=2775498 RepID=UPI00258A8C01|nr:MAG: hypothetical protein MjAS7_1573 [Metallosphaera javensis (ex Sakai et al. 2022)]